MAGRVYCAACRGYGGLFKQEVTYYGNVRIAERGPIQKAACPTCGGTGYANPDGPARGTVPVLSREKKRKAEGGVRRKRKAASAPLSTITLPLPPRGDSDLAAAGEGGTAGSV